MKTRIIQFLERFERRLKYVQTTENLIFGEEINHLIFQGNTS